MARIPGLAWRPLPENATQPAIRPTQWIIHTAVDGPGPTNLGDYFERKDVTLESHTWLSWTKHEQLMDTEVRADANYKANVRAISTETEDDGTPVERPWTQYQLGELIRTGVALNRLHGIPPVLPPTWDAPGMGYHSLYPGVWTPYRGKTCPGATRIHQFKTIVLPGIQAALVPKDTDMRLLHPAGTPNDENGIWLLVGDNIGPLGSPAEHDEIAALGIQTEVIKPAGWARIKAVCGLDSTNTLTADAKAVVDEFRRRLAA